MIGRERLRHSCGRCRRRLGLLPQARRVRLPGGPLVPGHRSAGLLPAETNRAVWCQRSSHVETASLSRSTTRRHFARRAMQSTRGSPTSSRSHSVEGSRSRQGRSSGVRPECFGRSSDTRARCADRSRRFERLEMGQRYASSGALIDARTTADLSDEPRKTPTVDPRRNETASSSPIELSSVSGLRRCFVQFMHPGGEHGPDTGTHKAWNVHDHKRKFLRLRGEACPTTDVGLPPLRLELAFWGEWEPESETEELSGSVAGGRNGSTGPIYVPPREFRRDGRVLQNTDPFVYGDRFLYTLCRQWRKAGGIKRPDSAARSRRRLVDPVRFEQGRRFVLDTVFVVGASVLHDATRGRPSLAASFPTRTRTSRCGRRTSGAAAKSCASTSAPHPAIRSTGCSASCRAHRRTTRFRVRAADNRSRRLDHADAQDGCEARARPVSRSDESRSGRAWRGRCSTGALPRDTDSRFPRPRKANCRPPPSWTVDCTSAELRGTTHPKAGPEDCNVLPGSTPWWRSAIHPRLESQRSG